MLADLYILQKPRLKSEGGGLLPLGSRKDVIEFFRSFNTAPDREGAELLHGPGIRVEMPPSSDQVMQLPIHVTEDELFHILFFGTANEPRGRLLRDTLARGWRFYDPVREEYVPPFHDGDDDDDFRGFSNDDDE